MVSSKEYYPFLDILRAISVIWVLFHHAHFHFVMKEYNFGYFDFIIHRLAEIGILGVDIFFVISGFLITGLLKDDFLNGQTRIRRFYARRFFKIIPQYLSLLFVALIMLAVFFPDGYIKPIEILAYLGLFQNYLTFQMPIVAHTWSIAIEEHFYLAYPLLLWIIGKLTPKRDARFIGLLILLVAFLILGNVLRFFGLEGEFTRQQTHVRFDALVFGCIIRLLEPWIIKGQSKIMGCLFFFLSVIFYYMLFIGFSSNWYSFTASYVAAGLLIITSLKRFKPFTDLEQNKVLIWIGKNSYGIYLWHYIVIFLILYLSNIYSKAAPIIVLLYFVTSIGLGRLSTITIERHFLNFRNKWIP